MGGSFTLNTRIAFGDGCDRHSYVSAETNSTRAMRKLTIGLITYPRIEGFPMRAWRWLADTTAYLTLFITVSGIYLWYVLRAERRIGYVLLGTGTLLFFGLAYVVAR